MFFFKKRYYQVDIFGKKDYHEIQTSRILIAKNPLHAHELGIVYGESEFPEHDISVRKVILIDYC